MRWYRRRFQAMPSGEVRARLSRTVTHRWDDLTWQLPGDLWTSRWRPSDGAVIGDGPAQPIGFLTRARAAGLRELCPPEAEAIVAAAMATQSGRIRFFGYPEVELGAQIDFAHDPHADVRWPSRHGKRIDYRHIGEADPKWIWELNRCQQLPLLIEAWLLSGEESYAETAVAQTLTWAAQNPPGRGIAWANGYEAGLRAISLSLTIDALRGSAVLTAERRRELLEILWQHARWIRRDPSTHSSANNHRMGELAGMVCLCTLAPELAESSTWLRDALAELVRQASVQVLPDGTGAEMAFGYHLHVVDLLLVATAVLDAAGTPVPEQVLSALERSGDAIWAQIGADEPALRYGDSDDAVAARLGSAEIRDARSLAASIASRLEHPKAALAARAPDWPSWWLFGERGRERLLSTEPAPGPGSALLPDAGLVLLRRAGARVTLDVGPLGYLSLAAHGHADALALTLVASDEDLVCDPGVGSYFRDSEAREAFRSTAFHATVEVDGESQSEPAGAFLWSRHANATASRIDLDAGLVFAEHDGYLQLSDPVRHRRAVLLLEDGELLVCDLLNARRPHALRQHWPLAPQLQAEHAVSGVYHSGMVARGAGGTELYLDLAATAPARMSLLRGRRDPMRGWWSDRLESFEPAWLCEWAADAAGDAALVAIISAGSPPPSAPLRAALDGASVLVERERDGGDVLYRIDFAASHMEAERR